MIIAAAAWLPFYDNWRWAQAGDTYPWYWLPVLALALPADDLILIAFAHCSIASYLLYRGTPQSIVDIVCEFDPWSPQ